MSEIAPEHEDGTPVNESRSQVTSSAGAYAVNARTARRGLSVAGTIVAVVLVVLGLAVAGYVVLWVIAFNKAWSNK